MELQSFLQFIIHVLWQLYGSFYFDSYMAHFKIKTSNHDTMTQTIWQLYGSFYFDRVEAPKHLSFNSTNGSHVMITLSLTVFLFNAKNSSVFFKQNSSLVWRIGSFRFELIPYNSVQFACSLVLNQTLSIPIICKQSFMQWYHLLGCVWFAIKNEAHDRNNSSCQVCDL